MSAFRMVSWGTQPLGALLGGLVAAAISVRAVWSVAAVVYVAVAIATLRILREVDRGPR
jgi:predicted MFS family arabinose efflux permease